VLRPRAAATTRTLVVFAVLVLVIQAACSDKPRQTLLNQHIEARRLSAEARIQFAKATDASNRSVMGGTDELSASAAKEAGQATLLVRQNLLALQVLLQELDYPNERQILDRFNRVFAEYLKIDETILTLSVENTNRKAERLALGPARESADAFRQALEPVTRSVAAKDLWHAEAVVSAATAASFEVQAVMARHIASADEPMMSALEAQMSSAFSAAKDALDGLRVLVSRTSLPAVDEAASALGRLRATEEEIVQFSRLSTNTRSLELSLGHKRAITATCDATLTELADAIIEHDFKATRY